MHRLATVLREIARGGLAGLIAGVVVGGLGGRIAMSAAAILNPGAAGEITEAGAVVGRFTVDGTIALVIFGGLSGGAIGAVVWVVVSPWLPGTGARRALLSALAAVALGSFVLIESTNFDFRILGPRPVMLALLATVIALYGAAVAWLDGVLQRRLPRPGAAPSQQVALYGLVALAGIPFLILTISSFFSTEFSRGPRPTGAGIGLVVVGAATAAAWLIRLRRDEPTIPPIITWAGRIGLAAAVVLGAVHSGLEFSRILGAG